MKQVVAVHGPETGNGTVKLLAVALERALQRKLGGVPSPTLVNEAVSKLAPNGANPSPFVQHAIRVQEQLGRLHSQLQQRAQEPQDHAISPIQDTPIMPLTRAQKRSAAHDDDIQAQETKRNRLDSAGSARHRLNAPPSTSDNKVNPETKAPAMAMSLRSRTKDIRSDPKHAEPPRADSVGSPQASVTNSPSGLPVMGTGPPTSGPSNNTVLGPNRKTRQRSPNDTVDGGSLEHTKSQVARPGGPAPVAVDPPSAQMHTKDKLGTVSSPSISTAIPDAQGSPLPTVASPTAMGLPAYTRQQVGSSTLTSSFVANTPGIWAIQVGKPSAGQTDVAFVVDHDTAISVHRWASHRQGFDPDARHVVVHLVALPTTAVSAAQQNLSESPGGITPQAFALALRDLPPQWPEDGSLMLQLNVGQPRERTWFLSDMSGGMPLDVSSAICEGTNSLRIMQLKSMANIVFAIYAAPPTPDTLATALEWEKFRKLYSFQRPPSGWSLG
ncbi:hypothetical protein F5888DRAFT_1673159 [Russula emetica]|nr:hypothetical protein F5888DRAFT_1673159 [Russula emetica]